MYNDRSTCKKCEGFKEVSACCHDMFIDTQNGKTKCAGCGQFCETIECDACDGTGCEVIEDDD